MKYIGIDLGTTYSCISVYNEKNKEPEVLEFSGKYSIPSVVYFGKSGPIVGSVAKKHLYSDPARTVALAKTYLGTDKKWSIDGTDYTPTDISAIILKKLLSIYQEQLGTEEYRCVVTCPANYGNVEKNYIKNACTQANLNVISFLNEPTAAAYSYYNSCSEVDENILVFDLGGGTLDVTIASSITKTPGVKEYAVRASRGDKRLGGSNWDVEVQRELLKQCSLQSGIPEEEIRSNSKDINRIKYESEDYKIQLSSGDLDEEFTLSATAELIDFDLKQQEFERLTEGLLKRAMIVVEDALKFASADKTTSMPAITKESIDKVVLVGGSSRMPQIKKAIQTAFPEFQDKILLKDPDYSISKGACLFCKTLVENGLDSRPIIEKCPYTYGKSVFRRRADLIKQSIPLEDCEWDEKTGSYKCCKNLIYKGTPLPATNESRSKTSKKNRHRVIIDIYQNNESKDSPTAQYSSLKNCKLCDKYTIELPDESKDIIETENDVITVISIDAAGVIHVKSTVAGRTGECTIKMEGSELDDSSQIDQLFGV